MRELFFAMALLLAAAPALAVLPGEQLADPALEARARALSRDLRCQVCQNQSIDDSNAPLAADLRRMVRERIVAGDDDARVLDFLVRRYGDYVMLRPPMRAATWALWFGPVVVLVVAASYMAVLNRRRRAADRPAALSADEEKRLARLIEDSGR